MLTNVLEIGQGEYSKAMDFTIASKSNLLIFGQAGIGKTEMAIQAALRNGYTDEGGVHRKYEPIYLNLAVLEAPDLVGLPVIKTADGQEVVKYASPEFLPLERNADGKRYILIVDELDKAREELQNPCLELFQSRSINGNKIAVDAVIATGNLPDEGAFSRPVSHALTNRCMVFRLAMSFEPWQEWAVQAGLNPLIVGFLSRNAEWLSKKPVDGDPTAYSRPSPRSWSNCARGLDSLPKGADVEFQTLVVGGYVGMAAAVEFKVWLEHYRHIEPIVDALVKDGTHPSKEGMDFARKFVCSIAACNEIVKLAKKKGGSAADKTRREKEIHDVTKRVFSWIKTLDTEFQVGATKSTFTIDIVSENKLTQVPEFMEAFLQVRKAFKGG